MIFKIFGFSQYNKLLKLIYYHKPKHIGLIKKYYLNKIFFYQAYKGERIVIFIDFRISHLYKNIIKKLRQVLG